MNLFIKIFVGILLGSVANQINATTDFNSTKVLLNIAVIGAGASGLCSARHSIAEGHKVTVFEQNDEIGGVWYYTDEIGRDKYGLPIHTSMYQGLRTNIPYQLMSFPDFPYPSNTTPFPPQTDVLKYLHSYAHHFELEKSIKFRHLVVRVLPTGNDKWEIIVKNLRTNTFETSIFDAVFVCNGLLSKPFIPNIVGAKEFNGKMIHSHDYRKPEPFHDANVLVIGGGSSGTDLVSQLSKVAKRVTFSRHRIINETEEDRQFRQSLYSTRVTLKDDVVRFTPTGAEFIDGSHQTFDVVFFATGYNFTFPFLSVNTGIYVENKLVQPLYKQIFNVDYPTMAFVGLSTYGASNPMFDFRVRFALKFITGAKKLPTKSEMLKDVQIDKTMKYSASNFISRRIGYIKQLSELADIEPVPDVLAHILEEIGETYFREPNDFRKYRYVIIDDRTFRKEKYVT